MAFTCPGHIVDSMHTLHEGMVGRICTQNIFSEAFPNAGGLKYSFVLFSTWFWHPLSPRKRTLHHSSAGISKIEKQHDGCLAHRRKYQLYLISCRSSALFHSYLRGLLLLSFESECGEIEDTFPNFFRTRNDRYCLNIWHFFWKHSTPFNTGSRYWKAMIASRRNDICSKQFLVFLVLHFLAKVSSITAWNLHNGPSENSASAHVITTDCPLPSPPRSTLDNHEAGKIWKSLIVFVKSSSVSFTKSDGRTDALTTKSSIVQFLETLQ